MTYFRNIFLHIISERAKKDLVEIWQYTLETWSEEQAIRYYNELLDECERITKNPDTAGRNCLNAPRGERDGVVNDKEIFFSRAKQALLHAKGTK